MDSKSNQGSFSTSEQVERSVPPSERFTEAHGLYPRPSKSEMKYTSYLLRYLKENNGLTPYQVWIRDDQCNTHEVTDDVQIRDGGGV
jgi:hypothetical protein